MLKVTSANDRVMELSLAALSESDREKLLNRLELDPVTKEAGEGVRELVAQRVDDALAWMRIANPGANRKQRRRMQAAGEKSAMHMMLRNMHLIAPATKVSVESIVDQAHRFGVVELGGDAKAELSGITPNALGEVVSIGQMFEHDGGYILQCLRECTGTSVNSRRVSVFEGRLDQNAKYYARSWRSYRLHEERWWQYDLASPRAALIRPAAVGDVEFIEYLLCMQLEERYDWVADIAWGDSIPVRISTDAIGAREFFAMRDAPNSGRKPALLHWVRNHWRKRRADPDALAYVRKHLRGKTEFTWNGYSVRLHAPRYEVQRAKVEAACMKHGAPVADVMPALTSAILRRKIG